jgi:PAS domain S-box-containing protein
MFQLMKTAVANRLAVRATVGYAVFAAAWILFSDALLSQVADVYVFKWVSMVKGVSFVLVTSIAFFLFLDAAQRRAAEKPTPAEASAPWPRWIPYAVAVLLSLATLLLRSLATPYVGEQPLRILFMIPIIVSALAGGIGPGLVATLLAGAELDIVTSTAVGEFLDEPLDVINWLLLIANGVLVSVMSEVLHRSRQMAEQRRLHQEAAQRALGESEARLRRALKAAGMGVWEWDARTGDAFASPECNELLGLDSTRKTPDSLTDVIAPTDAERLVALAEQAIVERTTFAVEFRVAAPDGLARWLGGTGRAEYAPDGQPLRLVGTVQDVTERHAREADLARLSRAYASLGRINKLVSSVASRNELFSEACRIAADSADYRVAWVGWVDKSTKQVVPLARAGDSATYVDQIRVFADDRPEGRGPVGTCIREDHPVVYNHFLQDSRAAPWQELAAAYGLRSIAVTPLHFEGAVCGAFAVYAADADDFHDEELTLLAETAATISAALARLENDTKRRQAEAGLRQREALLERTSRMAKVGGWSFEVKTMRGHWTDEIARIHDLDGRLAATVQEGLGYYRGESRAAIEKAIREAVEEAKPYDLELELDSATGVHKWVRTRGEPVIKDGRVIRVEGVMQDITDRKQIEQALAAERANLRALVNTIPDLVWLKDPNGVFLTCNPTFERFFGAKEAAIVGRTDHDFVDAELADFFRLNDQRAMAAGGPTVNEEWVTFADDGRRVLLETITTPMRSADGRLVGVLGIGRDITAIRAAEQSLKDSEAKYRLMVEGLKAEYFFYRHDPEGVINYVSPAVTEMLGYTQDEALQHFSAFLTEAPINAAVSEKVAAAIGGAAQPVFEAEVRHKDGSTRQLEVLETPVFDAEGAVVEVFGIARDVTARKQTEAALRKLSMAVEQSPVSIVITDVEGAIEYVNPAFTAVSGYSLAEALGQNPRILQSGKTPQQTFKDLWATLRAGRVWRGELVNRRKDGSEYVELATISPVRRPDGKTTHYLAVKEDITERKRIETELEKHRHHLEELVESRTAALQAAEEHARLILASSAAGLFGIDTAGRATFINPAACSMLGYTCEQMLGRPLHALIHHTRADGSVHPESECPMRRSLKEGQVVRVEDDVLWGADGQALPVQYAVHPMYRDGRIVGAVVSFFDVAAQRAAEAARGRALAEAERLAQVRSEFLANMSHEIRTPLNVVLGLAQIGRRKSTESTAREHFRRILDAGQLLLAIVNDVLDFSKIEAGKLELERVPCELGKVIDGAVDLVAPRAKTKGLELLVEEAPNLPATCEGDPVRLTQVLVNLLSNAKKFTAQGGVILFAGRRGQHLILRVTDTGIGMAPEQVKRLFAPFEQADGATTRRFGGTGLGLAISKRLVGLMGGEIEVTSSVGAGTSFEVRLPLEAATVVPAPPFGRVVLAGLSAAETCLLTRTLKERGVAVAVQAPDTALAAQADLVVLASEALDQRAVLEAARVALARGQALTLVGDTGASSETAPKLPEGGRIIERPLRLRHLMAAREGADARRHGAVPAAPRLIGYRILAAEDNEVNRLVLAEMLEGEGAALVFAENGRIAVEAVGQAGSPGFDVALMDIQMPEMGGFEATGRILATDPQLPIIGLTAHAMPQERQRCLDAGMAEHVPKPFALDELVAAIQRHARRTAPGAGEPTTPGSREPPAAGVVDWAGLEANFPGRPQFIDKLAATVLATNADAAAELRAAVARNDLEALAFRAHRLKGTAGSIMAAGVQALAKEAEAAARGEPAEAAAQAERLAAAVEVLLAEVAKHLAASEMPAKVEAADA